MLVIPAVSASAANYGSYAFKWPTPNTTVTGLYGENRDSGPHKGIDIRANYAPVYAAQEGLISFSGVYSDGTSAIHITHPYLGDSGLNIISRYLHLSARNYSTVSYVSKGTLIATSGTSGGVPPHLHFDINDQYVDYPTYSQTINPMLFYPTMSTFLLSLNNETQTTALIDEDHHHEIDYNNPDNVISQTLINYVGVEEFQRWFDSNPIDNRTNQEFKNHFSISDEKENQLNDLEIENAKQKFKDNPKAMSILNNLP
ncbi:M23 family metallopeptidase [Paenibacillus pseudetheri]|uniref:M23ase beta-sheet core domain-containing protein n=1 Tax=Paenibacillus pseudetheri TaxID=2897682 RepID=A0ABM9B890_9BACL|nr:M23 family metallopeptidase [Paenibacillus pseudetheri]CAH1054816.1 hypothetical protein PAECIP111894_00966 [Paenibacillus pseudetheri]